MTRAKPKIARARGAAPSALKIDRNIIFLLSVIELSPLELDFRAMAHVNSTTPQQEKLKFEALKMKIKSAMNTTKPGWVPGRGSRTPVDETYIQLFMAIDLAKNKPNFRNIAAAKFETVGAANTRYYHQKKAILKAMEDGKDDNEQSIPFARK
ncbi:unnamed protein product [Penicillium salamii]|uniref:Uncharacterized protein n=1 Tax=Penicillium salamii TaxID=1612424 RepID=A0A9W4IMI0_9EURO|nr:unnamed protein product [Penicillium salamii]CAG8310289.1 unnamed protein product [Penicillium salamii]CAG8375319.1 unnamed protein product [Penicillium salamii]CAG8409784.1 unnamed protein product [Penicillium salamii]